MPLTAESSPRSSLLRAHNHQRYVEEWRGYQNSSSSVVLSRKLVTSIHQPWPKGRSMCPSHVHEDCRSACRHSLATLSMPDRLHHFLVRRPVSNSSAVPLTRDASRPWSVASSLSTLVGSYTQGPSYCSDHMNRAVLYVVRHRTESVWSVKIKVMQPWQVLRGYLLLAALHTGLSSWGRHGVLIRLFGLHTRSLVSQP
jgi:hypothetical protein